MDEMLLRKKVRFTPTAGLVEPSVGGMTCAVALLVMVIRSVSERAKTFIMTTSG
jgi:hypothetical protein